MTDEAKPVQTEDLPSEFHKLLMELDREKGVNRDVFGRILERVAIAAPKPVSQASIARGDMLAPSADLSAATVSRALPVLAGKHRLVAAHGEVASGGRPGTAWTLDRNIWGLLGIHISHQAGKITGLTATLTGLDLTPIVDAQACEFDSSPESVVDVAESIAMVVSRLRVAVADTDRRFLGLGIEIGGHVHDGHIIQAHNAGWDDIELAQRVADLTGLATVVENDVNARAVLLAYRQEFRERDFVLVAVLNEGVGGALVIDGRLHRGAGGVAGEVGHLFVDYESLSNQTSQDTAKVVDENAKGFSRRCSCGQLGHVETLATAARILDELGTSDLIGAATTALVDDADRLTFEARTFRRAGTALGRALSSIANIVNPARLVLILPPELSDAQPGQAATAYLSAVESTLNADAFSTAAGNARANEPRLTVEALPLSNVGRSGAEAAGAFVLHALIEAARGRHEVARIPSAVALRAAG